MSREELQVKLIDAINKRFKTGIKSAKVDYDIPVVEIERAIYTDICQWLKDDADWAFCHFIDITAVDYMKSRDNRFEVVYILRSHKHNLKIRIKVQVAEDKLFLPTLTNIFIGASWTEREIFDMMGISFKGHPRMTRLLLPDDFSGHPLRKDFPVKGQHRGSFPRGSMISNKHGEPAVVKETHPKPLDQLLPRTPHELEREPNRKEGEDA
ncbi:MAG: NADH-quinone oxidoreductase subunit C [Candidatus Electryonea clarkiae]|nr:NADH-quinone oxidoreductase subunit C [Candidatus Electryonea clarkiae]MDP8288282.1 NADH-quinone oxidoreductase subunit C [Candidatus Electryonea clarkiae]